MQIPGPQDIVNLQNYSSKYFYLNSNDEMVFWLDSSEKGTTPNTKYIRSELRHLSNWLISLNYKIEAILKVNSYLNPDKVTVMKIHGFVQPGEFAPTLIRVAYNNGSLYAYFNKSNTPDDVERILLKSNIGQAFFKCEIIVRNKTLIIEIDDEEKFKKDISYWTYENFFKAGCYPQAVEGEVLVTFKKLIIE